MRVCMGGLGGQHNRHCLCVIPYALFFGKPPVVPFGSDFASYTQGGRDSVQNEWRTLPGTSMGPPAVSGRLMVFGTDVAVVVDSGKPLTTGTRAGLTISLLIYSQ